MKHDASTLYGSIAIPEEVIPPCDTDETELSQAECTAFPSQMLTYFHCQDSSAKYTDTVDRIKDAKCPGEDRLLQCELENRYLDC